MADELLDEFVAESLEHLSNIEANLLTIEASGSNIDLDLVNKVFRAAHSIKGCSGYFGLEKVKSLSHKAETILDLVRSGKMIPNSEIVNILLTAFDKLREMINRPELSEQADIADLLLNLTHLASSYLPGNQKATLTKVVELPTNGQPISLSQMDIDRAKRQGQFIWLLDLDMVLDVEQKNQTILDVFNNLNATGEVLDSLVNFAAIGSLDEPVGDKLPVKIVYASVMDHDMVVNLTGLPPAKITLLLDPNFAEALVTSPLPSPVTSKVTPSPVPPGASPQKSEQNPNARPSAQAPAPTLDLPAPESSKTAPSKAKALAVTTSESSLRVNVSILETLMNLAGELVLARNQLHEAVIKKESEAIHLADQRINQVTSEIQDAIMQTRLQPIGNVFGKFPRMVRDMASQLGKEIEVVVVGKEVGIDKSMIEALSDPLTHMVRNSADHGIEMPEVRAKAGKNKVGTVRIEARHEAGLVVIEIADDGKGLDAEKLAASALAKGLLTETQVQAMSEQDKVKLIFLPGFSTAEKVTDISGRGVGMDVVKTNLDSIGGKVEIVTEVGKGSTMRIKLPLTLAIMPSLIVSLENERFALPQVSIVELLRVRADEVKKRVGLVNGKEVLMLRDQLLPLIRFSHFLGLQSTYVDPQSRERKPDQRERLADRRSPNLSEGQVLGVMDNNRADRRYHALSDLEIAVLTTGTLQYALVVDAFYNTEEIVVKPLGKHLKGRKEYAGATILGDGSVALILDASGFATLAEASSINSATKADTTKDEAERLRLEESQSLLLFHNAPDELCAMPLDIVLRIEQITPDQIESTVGRRSMQYRGNSLPLVMLGDCAKMKALGDTKLLAVMVSSVRGREVGLVGAMPIDVVEITGQIDHHTHRQKGFAGSTIIKDKTAMVVDIFELADAVFPEWGADKEHQTPSETSLQVLLAEDTAFFRSQMKKYLEDSGYTVVVAEDGEQGWEKLLENVATIKAVVTDIEMPRLDGLGLARRIRADARTASLPIIAVTSLAGEEDAARGRAAGINEYQAKLDRDKLLGGLDRLLGRV